MAIEFELSVLIRATPQEIYETWLSSEGHPQMTCSSASPSGEVGSEFAAWDGYIHGKNLQLDYGKHIVQYRRTVEFEADDPDSLLEITFEPANVGTKLILRHTGLPSYGGKYE